jgi:hypothetical protein
VSRQTKPRKLSYSADDLDKSGIDDTKVEQILAKKPGITFNIQELVCSVLLILKEILPISKTTYLT